MSSPSPRTYAHALHLLSQLQSNKAVHSLFAPAPGSSAADLNALAIPEMQAWLRRAGYTPADLAARLRCVHVAGTKGKGSVAALTAAVLQRRRPRRGPVGTYSSPHVGSVRERIALDGAPIDPARFARYFFELWDRLSGAAAAEGGAEEARLASMPFYFRFLTLLAFHVFVREGCADAVVECGIGGEYDATNVLPAEAVSAAVVAQLGIDHVAMLGATGEEIAWHKAGVFKRGVRAFTRRLGGGGKEGVMRVLRERAAERGAELVELPDEWVDEWEGIEGARLQGPFQKHNMALAVAAAREHVLRTGGRFEGEFAEEGYRLASMPEEFREGLRAASLRGRCEVYRDERGVEWFLDGAHTEDSLEGVGQWYASRSSGGDVRRVLVFNQQDRDPAGLLRALLKAVSDGAGAGSCFDHAVFTRNEEKPPAAGDPSRDLVAQIKAREAMREFDPKTEASTQLAVESTIDLVRRIAGEATAQGKQCKVLVTGSFHLVGPVVRSIEHVEC